MTDLSKKIFDKMGESEIKPLSSKYFMFKRSVIWILFFLSIILGCLSSSVAIFQLKHADWDLYQQLGDSFLEFLLLIAPYFWIFFLICFTILVYFYFRRTERGYRYNTGLVILLSIIVSILGGELLYQTGFSEKLENIFAEKIPFYQGVSQQKQRMWVAPEKGLLAGKIAEVKSSQEIELIDFEYKKWIVDISNTFWRGRLIPEVDLVIKIIGKIDGDNRFVAEDIRPWMGKGQRQGRNRNRGRNFN